MSDIRISTKKVQFERLVALIEKNSDVVGDKTKGTAAFWEEVARELNELGPPIKDGSGWKKVWADYKSGLKKKKLAHNNREYRATGGGPCNLTSFSMLEKHVIDILDLRRCIEGTPNVPLLGLRNEDLNQTEPQPGTSQQQQPQQHQQQKLHHHQHPDNQQQQQEQQTHQQQQEQHAELQTPTSQQVQIQSQGIQNEEDDGNEAGAQSVRLKRRTTAELQLLELRKFNKATEKMASVKIKELDLKKQAMAAFREYIDLQRDVAVKDLDLRYKIFELKREIAYKELELREQISNNELHIKLQIANKEIELKQQIAHRELEIRFAQLELDRQRFSNSS